MVLGIDLDRTTGFYESLKTAGFLHIVVLSGSNIALLVTLLSTLTFPLLGRKGGIMITLCTLVWFITFVGVEPPIARAAVAGGLRLFGSFIGRILHPLYHFFLTVFFCLMYNPHWLSSLSFQLSCASAAALTLTQYPKPEYHENEEAKTPLSTLCGYMKDELKIALTAYLATLPLIVFYSREISVLSPFTNVLISWATGPIAVFGVSFLLIEPLHSPLTEVLGAILYPLLSWIISIAEASQQLSVSVLKV